MIRKFPSIFILVFIVGGIVLADLSRVSSWWFLAACLVGFVGGYAALELRRAVAVTILFSTVLMFFSAFHFAVRYYDTGPNHISQLAQTGKRWHIFGRVADWPDLRSDRTDFKIEVDSVADRFTTKVRGALIMRVADTTTALQRGDRVEFYGKIYPVRGGASKSFSNYRRHLTLKGVFGIVYVPTLLDVRFDRRNRYALVPVVDHLRDAVRTCFKRNLSAESAALASGILIGETRDIPVETYRRFRDSGTLHLLAVSGSNVALVVLFFVFLLKPLALKPLKRSLVLLAVILVFALLSYGEPSVIRASVMAGLVIAAGVLQRRFNLNNIIAAAAVIILLFDPAQLYDVGFQLSFTIAWGLIFIMPRLAAYFRPFFNRRWYRWLVFPFLVSLVAQICSVPLIAVYFGRVPLISPLANLLVVPLVSAGVVGILVLLVVSFILPLLGSFVGAWLNLLLEFSLSLVDVLGSDRMPSITMSNFPIWLAIVVYAFIFTGAWSLAHKPVRRIMIGSLIVAVNVALAAAVIRSAPSEHTVRIDLFGVPGGAAAVIQRPGHSAADLVVTGVVGRSYPLDERVFAPQLMRLGVGRLNALFVLSADYNAIDDMLRLAGSCRAERVYAANHLGPSFREVAREFAEKGQPVPVAFLGTADNSVKALDCYYISTVCGLELCLGNSQIRFADRVVPRYLNTGAEDASRILVIGCPWRICPEDPGWLWHRNFDRIYCSKIIQQDASGRTLADPINLPVNLVDLSLEGAVTLTLGTI